MFQAPVGVCIYCFSYLLTCFDTLTTTCTFDDIGGGGYDRDKGKDMCPGSSIVARKVKSSVTTMFWLRIAANSLNKSY